VKTFTLKDESILMSTVPVRAPLIAPAILLLVLAGCAGGGAGGEGASIDAGATDSLQGESPVEGISAEEIKFGQYDINMYPLNKVVCDPFGGGQQQPTSSQGVKGTLFYRTAIHPRWYEVAKYINLGFQSSQEIFMSQLNLPTRKFELGFSTPTGDKIKDDDGNVLIEYFGMRFQTVIKLAEGQEAGMYQLALLSDDGTVMRIRDENGVWKTIINNDGDHPTKMGCASEAIYMSPEREYLSEIDYYQGPRYHISLVAMWRKVDDNTPAEVECGKSGNNYFFNENTSLPRAPYNGLLSRGWTALVPANYALAQQAVFNPCKEGTAPVISNLDINEFGPTYAFVYWETDIPASSQVYSLNLSNGESKLTTSDNVLRTRHLLPITDLTPGTLYEFRAVSYSDDYGHAVSESLTFRMPQ